MRRLTALLLMLTLLISGFSLAEETATPAPTAEPTIAPTPTPVPTATPSPTPAPTPTFEELMDEYVASRFRARDVIGGALIIAKDGEILYSYDYGYKTNSKRETVTLDSCYRIASVTKLVSAVGLMQLIEEKGIDLDTPVKDIVGFPVVNPAFPEDAITIRQVMSHTSSFVQTQYYHPTWETLKVNNKYFSQTVRPGTEYAYSNLNGGLFGAMIEGVYKTGQLVLCFVGVGTVVHLLRHIVDTLTDLVETVKGEEHSVVEVGDVVVDFFVAVDLLSESVSADK